MKVSVAWVVFWSSFVFTPSSSFVAHPPRRIVADTSRKHTIRLPHVGRPLHALDKDNQEHSTPLSILQDYGSLMRPVTLLQAVGAWIVGRLVVLRGSSGASSWIGSATNLSTEIWAILAVFLSYGVGMAANDCADALIDGQDAVTSLSTKSQRAIASGRIGRKQGWIFVAILSSISLLVAFSRVSTQFGFWCTSNLVLMVLYALGLQKLLLVKNILVGWFCISPLWGATTIMATPTVSTHFATAATAESIVKLKMTLLAATGFSLGVIREILKDIEDVDLDRGTKLTLPLVIGAEAARILSFLALGITLVFLQSPPYRKLFTSSLPLYSIGWVYGSIMCVRASLAPTIQRQQTWVKRMIYVLLLILIGSLLAQ